MKVSLLVPNISRNCVGRAYILAKALQYYYEVEIIGPDFGDGIWPPCRLEDTRYKVITFSNYSSYFVALKDCIIASNTNVIYAIKPLLLSYGFALMIKHLYALPVVLDIDDWQVGMALWRAKQTLKSCLRFWHPHWIGWDFIFSSFTNYANDITVSNSFLHRKYGGYLVRHGRDANLFNPDHYDSETLKCFYGVGDKKIVMFLGTPRPHKGIEDLIEATMYLSDIYLKTLIVGVNFEDPYVLYLQQIANNQITFIGMQPFDEIPKWYAMADIVVIPQRKNSISVGQTPAKVFDAMAMAKPIVSTQVADMAEILASCGFIVPPGDISALANKIRYLYDNPSIAKKAGQVARYKFIKQYSLEVMQETLTGVFLRYR